MKNTTDIKTQWRNIYTRLTAEAEALRDSQSVSFGLLSVYDSLTESERKIINHVIADWLVSDDETLRYDAAFLIGERRIVELEPAVEIAMEQAARRTEPGAAYEVKKLLRILQELR